MSFIKLLTPMGIGRMHMNKSQTITPSLAGVALIINLLFPPWVYTFQTQGISPVRNPAGYALIFAPPSARQSSYLHGVAIDTSRLVVQSFLVIVAGGVSFGVATLSTRRRNAEPLSSL